MIAILKSMMNLEKETGNWRDAPLDITVNDSFIYICTHVYVHVKE